MSTLAIATCDSVLDELKKPWSATVLTETQKQHRSDVARAKELWTSILDELRGSYQSTVKRYDFRKSTQPFFPFFELPPELRNEIYGLCLENERVERNPKMESHREYYGLFRSKSWVVYSKQSQRVREIRASKPTIMQMERDEARRKKLNKIVERRLKHAQSRKGGLTPGALEALELYRQEHDMYTPRAQEILPDGEINHDQGIFDPRKENEKKGVLEVDATGNLLDDLPILSLVDRQIFCETFFLYYSMTREGLWVKWRVRNLDFFPFLRFYRSLTTGQLRLEIPPSRLHIELQTDEEERDGYWHAKKFSHVKRLVELHWLDGFPLWGCLTGLSDRQDCKGPFGDYMYSVRQTVALYRVDHEAWKSCSIKYLHRSQEMDHDDSSVGKIEALSDSELVEATIDMLCNAMEYNLGYKGSYSRIGRDGTEWDENVFEMFNYEQQHAKVAHEKEHAIVHIVGQYRKRIDKELKGWLGEAYDEWERLSDDARIPEDVIL
ncbi:hypothetical protein ACET3X_003284 [Alternaria dauci]|uniref:F-box domain-containing protein n=1 Tax=Alternaria dauci TaxID=48095 RepID=A0ABR3USG6_9PLEO